MKYSLYRTETADSGLRSILLYIAQTFGSETALQKLEKMEAELRRLADEPYIGSLPAYSLLKQKGFRVLIMEKSLAFYKVDENKKQVVIYAIVDQRRDYMNILRGM